MRQAAVVELAKRTVQWLLLAVTLLFLITGFGITNFGVAGTINLGWLSKSLAFRLHDNLWLPFLVLLVLHICLPFIFRQKARETER